MIDHKPHFQCLYSVASSQQGYFSTAQARECGFRGNLLAYHLKTGKFLHMHRGVYRLRDYPSTPLEEVMAAWIAVGMERAIVSHETALELLELGDVIADTVHLTVPRKIRNLPRIAGVTMHTTTRPIQQGDIAIRDGIRLTSATRSILDAAEIGTAPEQVEAAIQDALKQGITTEHQLISSAGSRSQRVQHLVGQSIKVAL